MKFYFLSELNFEKKKRCLARREEGEASGPVRPRQNRDLRHGVVVGRQAPHERVARLVVRDELLPLLRGHARALRDADLHLCGTSRRDRP